MEAPRFGCPKCKSANPRDDELCLDCTKAKLAWLSSRASGGHTHTGTQTNTAQEKSRSSFFSRAASSGAAEKQAKKGFRIPIGWIFVTAFVIFFFMAGQNMLPGVDSRVPPPPLTETEKNKPEKIETADPLATSPLNPRNRVSPGMRKKTLAGRPEFMEDGQAARMPAGEEAGR